MAVAKRPARDAAEHAAEGTVSARVSKRLRRMVMRIRIMRSGNSLGAESDAEPVETGGRGADAAAASAMDDKLKVCSDLPNDILCMILLLVPAVRRYQLQLVSRQWREVLTSADFRYALVAHEVAHRNQRHQQSRRDDMVVVCIPLGARSLLPAAAPAAMVPAAGTGGRRKQSPAAGVVDIDLSFLPNGFWSSQPSSYAVVALGGGLVCISDANGCLRDAQRLCVLNPLTRTCKVVPPVPIPQTWGAKVQVKHLDAGALTVLVDTVAVRPWPQGWVLATYDLEAGGGGGGKWTVVRTSPGLNTTTWRHKVSRMNTTTWRHKVSRRHLVNCGGKSYFYHNSKVYVHAVSPASNAFVETARVAIPEAPNEISLGDEKVALAERRGRVFLMHMVPLPGVYLGLWRIWMLLPDGQTWHPVAELRRLEFNKLTGFRYADYSPVKVRASATAAGDLLCFELRVRKRKRLYTSEDMGDHGQQGTMWREIVMGFDVETRQWELVYDQEWSCVSDIDEAFSFELSPNSFL